MPGMQSLFLGPDKQEGETGLLPGDRMAMNLEESQQEVDRQIEEQGVVTLDSKTVPAIENLIRNALNAQEAKEAANPEPPINLAYEIWLKQGAMQARGQYLGNEHD